MDFIYFVIKRIDFAFNILKYLKNTGYLREKIVILDYFGALFIIDEHKMQ